MESYNDQRPILHISSNTFHQRKCFVFVIFVCQFCLWHRPTSRNFRSLSIGTRRKKFILFLWGS